ncbi:unnamed protein product [Rotaria sp. Silwood1]|nr:unnamed protein product [Rotaria sp. Silwood1]CAF4896997.1 unnamed protein product [Rotaria sp. Silwood1]
MSLFYNIFALLVQFDLILTFNLVLDFYGVMRFYFQDAEDKVTRKCIHIASTTITLDVIRILMEKLRADM